jgi:uncharacterized protein YeaO (DUF488 family)
MVHLKRAYEPAARDDGHRVLVERLWPRGLRKEQAHLDEWLKDIAPSDALRKWFHHDPKRWPEFEKRYARELSSETAREVIDDLVSRATSENVTLVFSAHDERHNNAVVLKEMIEERLAPERRNGSREALVDEEIAQSFPASDPPSWTSLRAGGPKRDPMTAPPRPTGRR